MSSRSLANFSKAKRLLYTSPTRSTWPKNVQKLYTFRTFSNERLSYSTLLECWDHQEKAAYITLVKTRSVILLLSYTKREHTTLLFNSDSQSNQVFPFISCLILFFLNYLMIFSSQHYYFIYKPICIIKHTKYKETKIDIVFVKILKNI